MKKYLLFLFLFFASLTLWGCGGSGGDASAGITPQQQEFADVLTVFAKAVNGKDKVKAASLVDSRIVYNKTLDYEVFVSRLNRFIEGVSSVNFVINDMGVSLDTDEEVAEIRADIRLEYDSKSISERVEIQIKKSGSLYGITRFQKYGSDVSAFPPVLE